MKLPKRIEVLNRTYIVVEKEIQEGLQIGRSSFLDGQILIDSSLDSQAKADTLLHEIIHVILIAMGHELDDGQNLHTESNVLIISNGLATFLRDNKDTFKNLIDALD